jgi:hypothetical protein
MMLPQLSSEKRIVTGLRVSTERFQGSCSTHCHRGSQATVLLAFLRGEARRATHTIDVVVRDLFVHCPHLRNAGHGICAIHLLEDVQLRSGDIWSL